MQNFVRRSAKTSLLALLISVSFGAGIAYAQSGSTGGSIGNDEKSLSGSRDAPRSVESSKPTRRSRPEAEAPRRASRPSGGGGGSFDGAWATTSVGCGGTISGALVITSGRIIGDGFSGHVNPNGSATGAGSTQGMTWTSSGRFSARSGSGSYRRADGCVGSWTASKQ
jgi:hypothetical protein